MYIKLAQAWFCPIGSLRLTQRSAWCGTHDIFISSCVLVLYVHWWEILLWDEGLSDAVAFVLSRHMNYIRGMHLKTTWTKVGILAYAMQTTVDSLVLGGSPQQRRETPCSFSCDVACDLPFSCMTSRANSTHIIITLRAAIDKVTNHVDRMAYSTT